MSQLQEAIKSAQLAARKLRNAAIVDPLTTLLGDLGTAAKNAQKELSDLDVVGHVKKYISNVNDTIDKVSDELTLKALEAEKKLYEQFLPKQMSEVELTNAIKSIIADVQGSNAVGYKVKIGDVMPKLQALHAGNYDARMASFIVKVQLA